MHDTRNMLRLVSGIAARQLGLVTEEQLQELGMSITQIRWKVHRDVLCLIRPRVYRVAGAPVTWEQAVLAAVLSAGGDAVISHATAAAVLSLRFSDRQRAGIHMTGERRIRLKGVTAHQIRLRAAERSVHRGIPITSVERTILDLAGSLSDEQLGKCVDDAIRRDLMSLERLRRLAEASAPSPGRLVKPVHKVLADRLPGYRPDESDFEAEMNRKWEHSGLPPGVRQHEVLVNGHRYRLDRAIPECKIGIEWDSYRFHNLESDRDYDSTRRAWLASQGWFIIPVTANADPEAVVRAVWRVYRDRGGPG